MNLSNSPLRTFLVQSICFNGRGILEKTRHNGITTFYWTDPTSSHFCGTSKNVLAKKRVQYEESNAFLGKPSSLFLFRFITTFS